MPKLTRKIWVRRTAQEGNHRGGQAFFGLAACICALILMLLSNFQRLSGDVNAHTRGGDILQAIVGEKKHHIKQCATQWTKVDERCPRFLLLNAGNEWHASYVGGKLVPQNKIDI